MSEDDLFKSGTHFRRAHERWTQRANRVVGSDDYRDEWYAEQCGSCRYWLPLTGAFSHDYGGCSNPASPFDKVVMFEHDGCEAHEDAGHWIVPDKSGEPSMEDH